MNPFFKGRMGALMGIEDTSKEIVVTGVQPVKFRVPVRHLGRLNIGFA
jgi:hypothetical protein